ncbi:MAG: NAD-dependent epimerase/dehydratase family protein [Halioglobus sp.]
MANANKIITVTGASGFVGRVLVQRLLQEKGIHVRCLVRPDTDCTHLNALEGDISFCEGDITQPDTLTEAMEGAWGVVNLAGYREFWARDREHFYRINRDGAQNVFRACLAAGVAKVVQVSTPLAYGAPETLPFDEQSAVGKHPSDYARSKYLGDQLGWKLHDSDDLPLTIVYLAAVIGAGDDKETMEVRRAVEKRMPALVGADTTYTYVYVRDAAEAIARALLQDNTVGRKYLIGDQRATTREYFNIIGELADVSVPDFNIPEKWLMPAAKVMSWMSERTGKRPVIPMDVIKTTAAGSLLFKPDRAIDELNMRYTPLKDALAEAVEEITG